MTPEVEALGIAAIRGARWVVDGPLVAGRQRERRGANA